MKRCSRCGELKPWLEFHVARRAKDGRQTYCKPCQLVIAAEHRTRNPQKHRDRDRRYRTADPARTHATYRKWDLKTAYGITPDDYDRMLAAQGGVCAICGAYPLSARAGGRRLAMDHDHRNGINRRLLCGHCNRAVGLFEDNPEWLREAARYLEEARNAVYVTV